MKDIRIEKLANTLLNYSIKLKKWSKIYRRICTWIKSIY